MTITPRPEQERVIQQAIETGMYNSVDEVLDFALDFIRKREAFPANATRSQIAGQRIRELRKGVTRGPEQREKAFLFLPERVETPYD
jgi:Arc/MetJ-type ribon-helix-helix transcriptional regulator